MSSSTTSTPPGRALAALAYDAADGYVLLFGGTNLSQTTTAPVLGDTWTYQNGIWTNITGNQTAAPAGRYASAMTYDASDGYVVLFGGYRFSTGTYFGDTWTFSKGHWTNITSIAGTPPSPRWRANIAYDGTDGYVLLFGGTPGTGTSPASDTWKFKGGTWTQLNPTGTPPPLFRTSMVFDASDAEVILFGGCDAAVNQFGSCPSDFTWAYKNLTWTNLTPSVSPPDRGYEYLAYDPAYGGVLLFGGNPDLSLNSGSTGYPMANDTWVFSAGNWTNVTTSVIGAPGPRAYGEMVWDPNGGYILMFGGWTDATNARMLDETWTFGPPFVAWLQPGPDRFDIGGDTNLTTVVVPSMSGLTAYYAGLPVGCSNSNTLRLTCTPTSTGGFLATVQVTDTAGATEGSNATIYVDSTPSLSPIHAFPAIVGAHIPARFNVTASGGTPPYGFSWSGLPTGCSSANSSSLGCTPSVPGTYSIGVALSDAGGGKANATLSVVVNASYVVGFNETGLPNLTSWSVTVGGTKLTGTGPSLSLNATNGTLPYRISPIAGYATSTYAGNVSISGKSVFLGVKFAEFTYAVAFHSVDLPVGTNWSVNVSGRVYSATTASLSIAEPNGTYSYSPVAESGYVTPKGGTFTVKGAGVSVNLTYDRAFAIAFSESGLPSGHPWNLTLSGNRSSSNTSSISFQETNGSYTYSIGAIPGYSTTWSGSVKVNGAPVTVNVTFIEVTYLVRFAESGLPLAMNWTVSVANGAASGTGPVLSFDLPNGTFAYSITPIPGYTTLWGGTFTIDGTALQVNVTFVRVTYTVAFLESGLPTGTDWGVDLANDSKSTSLTEVEFQQPNATNLPYRVEGVPGYHTTWVGTVSVAGENLSQPVPFAQTTYSMSFNMTGLPAGTNWSVTLAGRTLITELGSVSFVEPNGTYAYRIGRVPGFTVPAWSGSVLLAGANRSIAVPFNATLYTVTFVESGLAKGTYWSVALPGGVTIESNSPSMALRVTNGSYAYLLGALGGYTEHPRAGSVVVNGANRSVSFVFVAQYSVTFTERGLPTGTAWSVEINGTTINSTSSALTFVGPAGGYSDRVGAIAGYLTNWTGSVNLVDRNLTVNLTFSIATYLIQFSNPGVAAGTTWTVTLIGPNGTLVESSSGDGPVVFVVANGSYRYSISAPGYRTANGTTAVVGPPTGPVSIVLQALASGSAVGGGLGLLLYVAIAAIVAAAVVVALLAMRRRRASPPTEDESHPEAPPEEAPPQETPLEDEPLPPAEPEATEPTWETPPSEPVEPTPEVGPAVDEGSHPGPEWGPG